MGLGKTSVVLTVLSDLFDRDGVNKVLIIAPLRVAVQTWPTEIREWSHTWPLTFTVIRADEQAAKEVRSADRTMHKRRQKERLAQAPTMIHIINREAVEWLVNYHGKNWPYDCVIVDESTSFSDHRTKRWKALSRVRPLVTRMHLLSGIPAPEGIEDYFAQIYLLDRGERFGRSITRFKEQYMIPPYIRQYAWKPRPGAEREIAEKIGDICIVMREEDYLDRPKALIIERPITLERHELKAIHEFENDMITRFDETEIEAPTGSVLAQKLLQMASGAIYDTEGVWHRFHDHKLEELAQLRDEAQGSPLLVAYWHRASLERIQAWFPKAVKMDREGTCVDAWNRGEIDMLLIHPRSAGHGLNMQHGPGHTLIWFDNPLPLEDYLQTIKRLDRPGQKKLVRVYHLVAQRTVDAKVVPVLRGKDDAQDTVKRYIRDLYRRK